jgi:hypothetical protein
MTTIQNSSAYFEAFTKLQTELMGAYDDAIKKADPSNITGNVTDLQLKLVLATLDNLTETVKQFRKTVG